MTTTRGFVERIEAGRGGLVKVTVVNDSLRTAYTISDIDGDPERFNERLTKIALMRDAMNRAEPVEIETEGQNAEIERAARITRDELLTGSPLTLVGGLVLRVAVESRNANDGEGEAHDQALVSLIGDDGQVRSLRLDLQAPERLVAAEQLQVLRDAQAAGGMVQCLAADSDGGDPLIVTVWVGESSSGRGQDDTSTIVSGFVETLGIILPAGATGPGGSLALTRITTSPELTGIGGSVDPAPFDPQQLAMFVARGSVSYALLEAALRKNVRVSVRSLTIDRDKSDNAGIEVHGGKEVHDVAAAAPAYVEIGDGQQLVSETVTALVLGVEMDAPLASASRPVWVHIDREMLDRGPAADCVPGLPSTSLVPRTLRDLRIPYPAEWVGHGCFNHGVYRFQLTAPAGSTIVVDDKALCLYAAGEGGQLAGYACLEGDHCVRVLIPEYMCDTEFDLDAYRVR